LDFSFFLSASSWGRPSPSSRIARLTTAAIPLIALAVHAAPAAPLKPTEIASPTLAQGRHADPALEALLPITLGGVTLTVESQAGTDLATRSAAFDAFLAGLGKARADFSLASAYARGGLKAEIGAWRVKGADPARLLQGFRTALQASSTTPLGSAEETLAGRPVTRIGDPGQLTRGPLYVFVQGETLLFVQTTERALAEEAMEKLSGAK
jgi:hypothetical protein